MLIAYIILATLLLPITSSTKSERHALVDLYRSAHGEGWRRSDNWITSKNICTWYGVTCSNTTSRIIQFSLYDNLLEGTIPDSLSALTELKYFALSTNKLRGPIPPSLHFANCEYFDLRYNFLNSSFPPGLANMTKITHLVLANNAFTDNGGLDSIVKDMRHLSYFDVRSNQLLGVAPASLCTKNLTFCGLVNPKYHTNAFSTIPNCLQSKCII
jgi:hypothetical protein